VLPSTAPAGPVWETALNSEIKRLFDDHLQAANDPVAAAVLVLADMLYKEPVIVESDDPNSYTVKDAAGLMNLSSRQVYQMCLAGQLRCFRAGRALRIPLDEIERHQ
jgi:excisionase family DNA binding protein